MTNRTELDIIINEFLLSKLNAKQFISNNLFELNAIPDKIERITSLIDYLKTNSQEPVLSFFYEEQLANIPINRNEITFDRLSVHDRLDYIESLREDAFEQRLNELKILQDVELPIYLKNYQKSNNNIEKPNGFNYQDDFGRLVTFHKLLINKNYIECEYQHFKKFFKVSFTTDENLIYWKTSLVELYYLIQEFVKENNKEDGKLKFDKEYRKNIPHIFKYFDKKKTQTIIPLDGKTLSQNNKIETFDSSELQKIIKSLL